MSVYACCGGAWGKHHQGCKGPESACHRCGGPTYQARSGLRGQRYPACQDGCDGWPATLARVVRDLRERVARLEAQNA